MSIDRRQWLRFAVGGLGTTIGFDAIAQGAWQPSRSVTIVVPYPAGGPTDVIARLVGRTLQAGLGGAVIVENQGGASGSIGTRRVARAEPDGHTFVISTNQTHATNISLLKDGGGYDPIKDFAPVAGLADLQHLVVTRRDLGVASTAELIALAKQRDREGRKLTCASTGIGAASHLTLELFKARTGTDFVHVPYRGSAPLIQDLVGQQVDISFATVPTVLGQVQADQVKALSVASPNPSPHLPQLPTLASEGLRDIEADAWIGMFAPAATPAAVIGRCHDLIAAAFAGSQLTEEIRRQGANPNLRPPAAFGEFQKQDVARWAEIIRIAKVQAE